MYSGSELTTMSLHISHPACGCMPPKSCISVQNHALLRRMQRSTLLLRISFLGQQLSATSSVQRHQAAHQVNLIRCRSTTSELRQNTPLMSRRVRQPPVAMFLVCCLVLSNCSCLGPTMRRISAIDLVCACRGERQPRPAKLL